MAAGANKEARRNMVGQWDGKGQHGGGVDWGVRELGEDDVAALSPDELSSGGIVPRKS